MNKKINTIQGLSWLTLGAAISLGLSGCGGTTEGGSNLGTAGNSGPVIYGINATLYAKAGSVLETSGIGKSDGSAAYITGAINYKVLSGNGPLPVISSNFGGTIPLGFSIGAGYINGTSGQALQVPASGTPGPATYVFRAYLSNGIVNNVSINIDPNNVFLFSADDPAFKQQLTFDSAGIGKGPLGEGQYTTPAFALTPLMATTGLHDLYTTVADTSGQQSRTDFGVVVVDPGTVALFAQNITADGQTGTPAATAIATGDNVTIDGGTGITSSGTPAVYPSGYTPNTADGQGTVIFFVTPGTHTLVDKSTSSTGVVTTTTQTLTIPASAAGTAVIQ